MVAMQSPLYQKQILVIEVLGVVVKICLF